MSAGTKDEEAIIEAMARAMCEADGLKPDEVYTNHSTDREVIGWKHQAYLINARRYYAAHLAMLQAMEDLDRREAVEFTRRLEPTNDTEKSS